MSKNNLKNVSIQKRLVVAMVNKLLSEGYRVQANHIGYPNGVPNEVNKYTPDIHAEKKGKKIIIEAETCDSLKNKEIRLRWTAFSATEDIDFSIITPALCVSRAKRLAKEWKVKIKNYWTMDI